MSDSDKVKQLINSDDRQNQVIGIQLLVNTLGYSIEDAGLFYFFNKKPNSSFLFRKEEQLWKQSFWSVGFFDIRFSRSSEGNPFQTPDEECNYRCNLSPSLDKVKPNVTQISNDILQEFYPMSGNPPVERFFSLAIKLNLG